MSGIVVDMVRFRSEIRASELREIGMAVAQAAGFAAVLWLTVAGAGLLP